MIEFGRHLEILLLSNDCVIVPHLGGFMAHHIDAHYDESDGMFLPPLRTMGFNPQLKMNDSLLVQSYIEAYDISYPEAQRRIDAEVVELKQHLDTQGFYELNGIGVLKINEEGNLQFEPCEAGILTPNLYGLGAIDIKPVAQDSDLQDKEDEHAIVIKMSWLRNAVAVAVAAVTFLMVTTPVSNSEPGSNVQHSAFIAINTTSSRHEAPATIEKAEPAEDRAEASDREASPANAIATTKDSVLKAEQKAKECLKAEAEAAQKKAVADTKPAVAAEAQKQAVAAQPAVCQKKADGTFSIILASMVSKTNAEGYVAQLKNGGFGDAYIIENKNCRVAYGKYATKEEASKQLSALRSKSQDFKDAWILEIN